MAKFVFLSLFFLPLISTAVDYSDSLFAVYKSLPATPERIDGINDEAYSYWSTDPLLTEKLGKLSLQLSKNIGYEKGVANSNHILGIAYHSIDNYDLALEKFYIALPIYEDLGEKRSQANIYINLASVFDDLEQYEKAKVLINKALALMKEVENAMGVSRALNNAGVIYEHLFEYDSAIYFLEEAIRIRQGLNDTIGVARGYSNTGLIYKYLGQNDKAFDYYTKALSLNSGDKDLNLKASIYLNIGEYYLIRKNFELAKAYLDSGKNVALSIDSKRSVQEVYKHLKNMALAQNDYKQAFDYFQNEVLVEKERINEASSKRISDLQLQFAAEKSEKEIALLENERNRERFYRNLTLLALLASFAVGMIGFAWLRFRAGKKKQMVEAQQALTEAQLENALLREKELTLELEQKKRELTAYTLNFVQKSELLNDLKDSINKIKNQLPEGYGGELRQLNRKVEESFRIDQDWEDFKSRFEQVHHDFFAALKEGFPEITSSELKLCALLKLNFNLKEAAQIMGVAPESVKTARYRLKKKLALKQEESLVDFVLTFDARHQKVLS